MGLVGVNEFKGVDLELLDYAAKNIPCLIIDCSDSANPHRLYPKYTLKEITQLYVIPVELIYVFRDVIKHLPITCEESGFSKVVITRFGRLINYQDEAENSDLYEESWELLHKHSRMLDIRLAIPPKHKDLARKYCDVIL